MKVRIAIGELRRLSEMGEGSPLRHAISLLREVWSKIDEVISIIAICSTRYSLVHELMGIRVKIASIVKELEEDFIEQVYSKTEVKEK